MGICPYCDVEVHLTDFFVKELGKKILGKQFHKEKFVGEEKKFVRYSLKMFTCPHCNKILGFSELAWSS